MINLYVEYPATNESIEAVTYGLDLNLDDVVLSICSAGDIPFAIAPKVKKVIAVDSCTAQINFAKRRRNGLIRGNFDDFINPKKVFYDSSYNQSLIETRNKYFNGKLDSVKANAKKINFLKVRNIFDIKSRKDSYSKIYLSNAYDEEENLNKVINSLSPGGLIYFTVWKYGLWGPNGFVSNVSKYRLKLDATLTNTVKRFEHPGHFSNYWSIFVYRKVEETRK